MGVTTPDLELGVTKRSTRIDSFSESRLGARAVRGKSNCPVNKGLPSSGSDRRVCVAF